MKKLLAVLLSLTIIVMIVAPMSVMAQDSCECENLPIIYVRGRSPVYLDKDDPNTTEVPDFSEEFIKKAAKELVPVYTKCYLKDDFYEFKELMKKYMHELYKDFALDKNGNVTNNSGQKISEVWRNRPLTDVHKQSNDPTTADGAHEELYKYFYQYDSRLDPCEIADDLKEYIQAVKDITGHSRIKLLARCMGSNILSAYFAEYGWKDVDDVVLYNPICFGTEINDSTFNGELYFDADAVDFFATQNLDGSAPLALLKEVITLSNKINGLDMTMAYFNKTGTKVAKYVMPEVLRECYGTSPAYWSMVSADRFEEARDYIFAGVEDEYAGLIKKLNHYHETVGSKLVPMYTQMKAEGVNVSIVAKYGYQLFPIVYDSAQQSDMLVTCSQQAPGTTTAPIGSKLSDEYIANAKAKGTDKYISPDRAIDASTAMLPDSTWYVQNLDHNCYPWALYPVIYKILRHEGKTVSVFDDKDIPQYLIFNKDENGVETIRPMSEEDKGDPIESPSLFKLIKNMLMNVVNIIISLINKIIK